MGRTTPSRNRSAATVEEVEPDTFDFGLFDEFSLDAFEGRASREVTTVFH
jgi:hypothetical protein